MGSRKLFGTNGIRAIVTKELTPEMAVKVGSAIGTFFKTKSLLVGHDARTSGPMFAEAVISGLNAAGCDVLLAGMASTPALQFAVKNHGFDGGVIVTASHNPPEYNGIKVIWSDGIEISHEQETQIEDIYFDEKAHLAEWDKLGATHELPGVNEEYVEAIEKHVHTARIASKHFHIVVDAANSVGGLAAPILLRKLGCRVTSINTNIDGTFPGRPPEPRPENLWDVALTVKALGADVGVAFDGDADRAMFIAETGEVYWGSWLLSSRSISSRKARSSVRREERETPRYFQTTGSSLESQHDRRRQNLVRRQERHTRATKRNRAGFPVVY